MRGNRLLKFFDYWFGIPLVLLLSLVFRGKRDGALNVPAPKKILVVKLVALGDAVLLVPSLRALRKAYPNTEISFLGTTVTKPIIQQFPEYVDRFISLEVKQLFNLKYSLAMIRDLKRHGFDVVIDFEQWTRLTPLILAFANIPVRIGLKTRGQHHHFLYTHTLDRDSSHHEVDTFLSLVSMLTNRYAETTLELKVNEEKKSVVKRWLQEHGIQDGQSIVVIHPACGAHGFRREWPPENYRSLIKELHSMRKSFFVLSGMEAEKNVLDAIGKSDGIPVVQFIIPGTDDFIALLSLAGLVISGNTGAMHLAAALQSPQIALHGPTNSRIWGPVNPNATVVVSSCPGCPCLDLGFEYHREDGYCMQQVSFDEVVDACRRTWAS